MPDCNTVRTKFRFPDSFLFETTSRRRWEPRSLLSGVCACACVRAGHLFCQHSSGWGVTQTTHVRVFSNIVRVIKLRRMRWAGHAARMGEERGV